MSEETSSGTPWEAAEIAEGACRHWRIGPLGIWVARTPREWQVAEQHFDDEDCVAARECSGMPEDVKPMRWATDSLFPPVRLRPIAPDRSVVVRPEHALRILPQGSARIYISIPVWVRVELDAGSGPVTLEDVPTVRLSNTWFGSLFKGQLCYWTETTARRESDAREPQPHVATAPMTVKNDSSEELPLEKVCLPSAFLGIYRGGDRLWTSEVKVVSSSSSKPQKLDIQEGPPSDAPEAVLLSKPREKRSGGIFSRTVGLIQSIPGAEYVME
jgi:hypothetical protein